MTWPRNWAKQNKVRRRISIIAAIALVLLSTGAFAQTEQQLSERERLEKEIAILDNQLKANSTQSANALSQLSLVQSKISARQALVRESDREISTISSNITAKAD